MRHALTLLGIFLSHQVFSQFNYAPAQQQVKPNQIIQFKSSLIVNENSISNSSNAVDEIIWSEDFANGLAGNNTSTDHAWTVAGPNGA